MKSNSLYKSLVQPYNITYALFCVNYKNNHLKKYEVIALIIKLFIIIVL